MKKILIIGATSAIAEAAARVWAAQGHRLYLLGRNEERLDALAADLRLRGAAVAACGVLDVNQFGSHPAAIEAASSALDGLDTVLIAHGTLGDQQACQQDFAATLRELNTNAISVISLLTLLANRFEAQRHGTLAVISSVAGDRGRQSNYVYGTAKGALTIFLQGLRNRLHGAGVQVLTIKPGFVDTPMTAHIQQGPLWAKPEAVASAIVTAVDKRRDVLYTPWFWLGIMTVIRLVPERVFKKLKL
ncbi:SDR family oxidoreductase [Rugamonas apoptosis]|uniref:SDR family oxidoreductase n=1 Tax=Rugamonas apoptosis TaxID=2758570 RepID=A0A7W2IIS9_9BURK|nr:SDR family oxidoreductase [Rugamonas apoptosis]MBA5685759.1 SDR family oxidoreductase [Rugamonas apoptosis]